MHNMQEKNKENFLAFINFDYSIAYLLERMYNK